MSPRSYPLIFESSVIVTPAIAVPMSRLTTSRVLRTVILAFLLPYVMYSPLLLTQFSRLIIGSVRAKWQLRDFLATVSFNASVVSPLYNVEITRAICERWRKRLFVRFFLPDKTLFFGFRLPVFIEQWPLSFTISGIPSKTRHSLRVNGTNATITKQRKISN